MNRTSLSRRLLASAAGLAIGFGGALGLAAPSHADVAHVPPITAVPVDFCAGTYVQLDNSVEGVQWSVTAGGKTFYPSDSADIQDLGLVILVFVPADAGKIEITYDDAGDGWPMSHTWEQPDWCDDLPAPTHTQPTCDAPGEIVIPALPTSKDFSKVTHVEEASIAEQLAAFAVYRLNGELVAPGSTHTVEPGTHVVDLKVEAKLDFAAAPVEIVYLLQSWTIEIEEPDCPGEGGELPKTGTQILLIAGGALLLLTAGGAMFLVARRRRISFTA